MGLICAVAWAVPEENQSLDIPFWKKLARIRHRRETRPDTQAIPAPLPQPPTEKHVKFNLDHHVHIPDGGSLIEKKVAEKRIEIMRRKIAERKNERNENRSNNETQLTVHKDYGIGSILASGLVGKRGNGSKNGNGTQLTIPEGYEIRNVPGDGLCGYWAILLAKKAEEAKRTGITAVEVSRGEVSELLGRLLGRIRHLFEKQNKTDEEMEIVEELEQLIRDGYAKDFQDLCEKIRSRNIQLDSPLTIILAKELGCNIILERKYLRKDSVFYGREVYRSHGDAQVIRIYYDGEGPSGHYQAIIPRGIEVRYR
jgi:hypothetical protein